MDKSVIFAEAYFMLPKRQILYLYETLGSVIREKREAKGYKQNKFAELLKISRASLVNIEKGRQRAPIHNLYEIARLLGVSIHDLLPDSVDQSEEVSDKIEKQIVESSAGNPETEEKLMNFIKKPQK